MVNSPQYVLLNDVLYEVFKQIGNNLYLISATERYVYEWKDPRTLFGNNPWQPVNNKKTYEDYFVVDKKDCVFISPEVADIMRAV